MRYYLPLYRATGRMAPKERVFVISLFSG